MIGLATILVLPLALAMLDLLGGLRARHKDVPEVDGRPWEDFDVLVPIWGDLKYLENVRYLADYAHRVILCTTVGESAEFNTGIDALAARYGFRVYRARIVRPSSRQRMTSGTVRDRIIRDAHEIVRAPYVVCIDADTITEQPLGCLVGSMVHRRLDFASVRLVPSNRDSVLARIQAHEYRTAMLLRRIMPWLVSGACHVARSNVHKHVMDQHSLFFQGNDVETGLLADALGYRVGHIPFDVPTTVPSTFLPWWRQRLAWSGGEVRLFLGNPQIALRHPFWWSYGAVIAIGAFPLRWMGVMTAGWLLAVAPAIYIALLGYLHRGHWDRYLLVLPLYSSLSSLVLTPIGLYYYFRMSLADHNWGPIRPRRASIRLSGGGGMRHVSSGQPMQFPAPADTGLRSHSTSLAT